MQKSEISWTLKDGWRGLDSMAFEPQLVLFFGSRHAMASQGIYETLRGACPEAIVMGCSGGGQIHSNGIVDAGLTGIAMRFDSSRVKLVSAVANDAYESFATGRILARNLREDDLKGILLLTDGLDVNGDELMAGLTLGLPSNITVGGGMAADDDRFERTLVVANAPPATNMIAAIGFYGPDIRLTSGLGSGWQEAGVEFEITASRMNTLYDLDSVPAISLYEQALGDQAANLPMSGLLFPLKVCDPKDGSVQLVRTLLGIDRECGKMTFAGNLPEGWKAQLMRADPSDLISAAGSAADRNRTMDALATAQATILVSCIGRRLVLGGRSEEEVMRVKNALGAAPAIAGFYSYGEFATPVSDGKPKLYNQTMTAFSIGEVPSKAA